MAALVAVGIPHDAGAQDVPGDLAARIAAGSRQLDSVSILMASPPTRRKAGPAEPVVAPAAPSARSAASGDQARTSGRTLDIGPVTVTPGGFVDLEALRR